MSARARRCSDSAVVTGHSHRRGTLIRVLSLRRAADQVLAGSDHSKRSLTAPTLRPNRCDPMARVQITHGHRAETTMTAVGHRNGATGMASANGVKPPKAETAAQAKSPQRGLFLWVAYIGASGVFSPRALASKKSMQVRTARVWWRLGR